MLNSYTFSMVVSQSDRVSSDMLKVALDVLGAKASIADVERVFSTFGLV